MGAGSSSGCQSVDAAPNSHYSADHEEERLRQAHLNALQCAKTLGEESRRAQKAEWLAAEAAKRTEENLANFIEKLDSLSELKAARAKQFARAAALMNPARARPKPPSEPPPDWAQASASQWPPARGGENVREPEWPKPGEWKPVLLNPPTNPTTTARSSGASKAEPNPTEIFKESLDKGTVEIDETLGAFYTWKGQTYREKVSANAGVNCEHSMESIYEYVSNVSACAPCTEAGI